MKRPHYFLLLFIAILFSSSRDDFDNPSEYFPILMERPELEASIKFRNAQDIINPGKIYYNDHFIYLNERYKGIHIIDNHMPSDPQNIGFINIPGCIDMTIKNTSLFADNATDLVAIDLSNPENLTVTNRIINAFPEATPPDLDYIPYMFTIANRPRNTVIVGWERINNQNP